MINISFWYFKAPLVLKLKYSERIRAILWLLVTPGHQQVYWQCRIKHSFSQAWIPISIQSSINTLRLRQNGRYFPDDIFKWIFLNENVWIWIEISLNFVPKGPINNISALVRIMAWHRPCDKPWSEPMMVSLLTHICVTLPQWVNNNLRRSCSLQITIGSGIMVIE